MIFLIINNKFVAIILNIKPPNTQFKFKKYLFKKPKLFFRRNITIIKFSYYFFVSSFINSIEKPNNP